MYLVGLTGGISCGKTTVSNHLKLHQIPIVDADAIARKVVVPGTSAYKELRKHFDASLFDEETGELNREKMGELVFRDVESRKLINKITHPAIRKKMYWEILKAFFAGHQFVVLDVPLLFESGFSRFVQKIVVVTCSSDTQIARLMARDKVTRSDASRKITAQMPVALKCERAHFIIDNNGTVEETIEGVNLLLTRLKACWYGAIFKWIIGFVVVIIYKILVHLIK
uniref:Dephospho-CoA kinase domain-containing protein n=1 Tax=Rhabditophanes sp. KR3021 TaxID=114890 RepID=A0AC35TRV6_9BILA